MKICNLNKLLKYYFSENINFKNYKNKINKILNYCKKNFNILTYDKFFCIFKNIDLNDLNKIVFIIKSFNIKIIDSLPYNEILLNSENDKSENYKNNNYCNKSKKFKLFKKDKIIFKYYKNINKDLNKISKKIVKNLFLLSDIFKLNKNNKSIKLINKIENIKSNLIFSKKTYFKTSKNKSKILLKTKKIFKILNFLTFNIINFKLNKKKYEKSTLLKFLKKKYIKFKINLWMFDDFYLILNKKIKILFKIKSIIYDTVCNLTDLTYLEFNFYYLKYGSNLNWIKNVVNFNYLDKNFKNNFLKFLKKKSKKIKNLEVKYSTKSYNLIKILNYIELKKIKIDIMRNKIIKLKLNVVNRLTVKYKKNNFYNDCFQEGCASLIKSVNIYNINLNYGFENFLEYNIKKSVNCFMYNANRIIKIPPHVSQVLKEINIFRRDYKERYNSEPSTEYISESLNINLNKVKKILSYNKASISMNKIIDGEEYQDYFEQINNNYSQSFEKDIFYIIMKNQLSKVIKKESYKKYPNLINMRYGLKNFKKCKLKDISDMYNISRNKVSMLQKNALENIKAYFKNI